MSDDISAVELAAELAAAWLVNPNTRTNADDVPAFLVSMHAAVTQLSGATPPAEAVDAIPPYEPAVTVRKSLSSPDHILSMIDGKPYKTLRRHLATNGLAPEEYRARYNLKSDYPMVAPAYSEARRTMAKAIGLGRKPGQTAAKPQDETTKPARKPRPQGDRRGLNRVVGGVTVSRFSSGCCPERRKLAPTVTRMGPHDTRGASPAFPVFSNSLDGACFRNACELTARGRARQ